MMSRMGQQASAVPSTTALAMYSAGMPKYATLAKSERISATGQAFQAAILRPDRATMSQRMGRTAKNSKVTRGHPFS